MKWTRPESYHLTVRFAGAVDPEVLGAWSDLLAAIEFEPFALKLSGVGTFGGRNPFVLWVGIEESPELAELAHRHDAAAMRAGIEPEHRPFHPHLTIARLRRPARRELDDLLVGAQGFQCAPFLVERCALYASRPERNGGAYERLREFAARRGG